MEQRKDFEFAYWSAALTGLLKPRVPLTIYTPAARQAPSRRLDTVSAWEGIENILAELIERFRINTTRCIEFGVEHGFSTVALSCYFGSVLGVDTFQGDIHTANLTDIYDQTRERLAPYDNIKLLRSDYRDFIRTQSGPYGLAHVDIVHTYRDTFDCGLWAVRNSQCAIFHDTESFPEVKQAVLDLARATGKRLYNYEASNGLGILA